MSSFIINGFFSSLLFSFIIQKKKKKKGQSEGRRLRREGDDAMLLRKYQEAVDRFTQAIHSDAKSYLGYYKRAQAFGKLGKFTKAMEDFKTVLTMKATHVNTYIKRAKMYLELGNFQEAVADLNQKVVIDSKKKELTELTSKALLLVRLQGTLEQYKAQEKWDEAVGVLDQMGSLGGVKPETLAKEKVDILFQSGKFYEVVTEAMILLKKDKTNISALLLRAKAFYNLGEVDGAINHLKQCLLVDSENEECKTEMETVNEFKKRDELVDRLTKNNQWAAAVVPIKSALEFAAEIGYQFDRLSTKLCEAYARGGTTIELWKEGIEACTAAMAIEGSPKSCQEWRGDLHHKLGNWGEAISDFTTALGDQRGNHGLRQKIQRTQQAKKISERKDYYKILDVARDADKKTVKKAFRGLAKKFHPDKLDSSLTEEEKVAGNARFQDINEAYSVLMDEEKRGRFDRGEEVDQDQGRRQHNPFQQGGFNFNFNRG